MALTPALLELFGSAYEIKEQGGQVFRHLACFHLTGKAKLPYHMSRTDGAIVRLEITSKGQVALKKEVLDHLGVEPGDYVDIDREVNFIYRDRRSEASKIFPVH
jgi:hypothetical protein